MIEWVPRGWGEEAGRQPGAAKLLGPENGRVEDGSVSPLTHDQALPCRAQLRAHPF